MAWYNRKQKNEGLNRQIYLISNLGLFYIIIIALFAVPLLGTFVVVLIKGVLDLRIVIVPIVIVVLCLILVLGIRGLWRMMRRMRKDGRTVLDAAHNESRQGQPVQISIFNGLISLTVGHTQSPTVLPHTLSEKSLPAPLIERNPFDRDIACKLKDLVDLRNAGEIDRHEFEYLKAQLIANAGDCDQKQQAT